MKNECIQPAPIRTSVDLAKDLIKIPSEVTDREAQSNILTLVTKELDGFSHTKFERNGKESILFYNRSDLPKNFRLILHAHLDVVPGDSEQFEPYENENKLYGRGAQDMKAAAAVMILVFKHLASHLPYPIGLQLVTDEEIGGFDGVGYQVEQGIQSDFVITGESTDLHVSNEHKGVLAFQVMADTSGVIVAGERPGHAGYALRGQNAILKISDFLQSLQEEFPLGDNPDAYVTTINPSLINTTNSATNKVPTQASTFVDIRYIPQDGKNLRERIAGLLPSYTQINEESVVMGSAHFTDPSNKDVQLLQECVAEVLGEPLPLIPKKGSSDARFYPRSVQLGPTGKGLHSTEESVDIPSLHLYEAILMKFLTKLI